MAKAVAGMGPLCSRSVKHVATAASWAVEKSVVAEVGGFARCNWSGGWRRTAGGAKTPASFAGQGAVRATLGGSP